MDEEINIFKALAKAQLAKGYDDNRELALLALLELLYVINESKGSCDYSAEFVTLGMD